IYNIKENGIAIYDESLESIYLRLPSLKTVTSYENYKEHDLGYSFSISSMDDFKKAYSIYFGPTGGRYLVEGLVFNIGGETKRIALDRMIIDYLFIFILGDCVRY